MIKNILKIMEGAKMMGELKKVTKGILVFSAILMLIIFRASLCHSETSLRIQMLKYEPSPVEPGESFKVWFYIENTGSEDIDSVKLRIKESFPFYYEKGEEKEKEFSLPVGADSIVSFNMVIDEDAKEGEKDMTLEFSSGGTIWVSRDYSIDIESHEKIVSFGEVEVSPSKIIPGDEFELKIPVKNLGSSQVKDISVSLTLYSQSSLGTFEVPIVPIQGTATKHIDLLESGETKEIVFKLKADNNAAIGSYKVPISSEFYDKLGNKGTLNDIVGINIDDLPNVDIIFDSDRNLVKNREKELRFKIANKGLSQIKFVTIELKESTLFDISGPAKDYIGNIASDDYETADFTIIPRSNEGVVKIPIKITYLDYSNAKQTIEEEFEARTVGGEEYGAKSPVRSVIIIVVVLIAAVIGFAIWRKRKKD